MKTEPTLTPSELLTVTTGLHFSKKALLGYIQSPIPKPPGDEER